MFFRNCQIREDEPLPPNLAAAGLRELGFGFTGYLRVQGFRGLGFTGLGFRGLRNVEGGG